MSDGKTNELSEFHWDKLPKELSSFVACVVGSEINSHTIEYFRKIMPENMKIIDLRNHLGKWKFYEIFNLKKEIFGDFYSRRGHTLILGTNLKEIPTSILTESELLIGLIPSQIYEYLNYRFGCIGIRTDSRKALCIDKCHNKTEYGLIDRTLLLEAQ